MGKGKKSLENTENQPYRSLKKERLHTTKEGVVDTTNKVQTLRKIRTGNFSKFSIEEVVKIFGKISFNEVIHLVTTMKAEGEMGGKCRQPPKSSNNEQSFCLLIHFQNTTF